MNKTKILVVEDESIVAEDIKQVLKKLGYSVVGTVSEGELAVEFALNERPDVVLMDIVLKGEKTGIEIAKKMLDLNIPVIYLTAYADEITLNKAKQTAPYGFILKPFEEQTLKSTIEMALYKHSMEQKLREKELWFSTTLMSIGDGVIATDIESKIILMNPVAEKFTGWTQEEAYGEPLDKVFNLVNEKGEKISPDIERVFKTGEVMGLLDNTFLVSKQGIMIPVDDSIAPIKDKFMGIIGAVIVFHDIVERKLVERALKESEERYRSLFEESHDAIFITTRSGNFVLVNQSALNLFNYKKDEIIKLNLRDLFVNKEQWDEFKFQMEHSGSVKDFEVELYNKKKGVLYCMLTGSIRKDDEGELHGYQGIIRDITEKKKSDAEKEKIKAQLLQAQKMEAIGVLAGGVAHDFNNILTIIQGNLDLALMRIEDYDDPELIRDLKASHEASVRAADLTSQLLLFSRKQPMRFANEDLNQIIEDMLKMLHRLIGEDVSIKTDLAEDLYSARIDRGSIEQLIMNLVVNARDAMPEGGEVTIKTVNSNGDEIPKDKRKYHLYVKLSLSDNGQGIEENILNDIFNPFFTTKGPGKGTGLGLSVVFGIVQQHNGWIDVNSEPGKGTVFSVYLPVENKGKKSKQKSAKKAVLPKGEGQLVLVIEDEEGVRKFISEVLVKSQYNVIQAKTIEFAEAIIKEQHRDINLILCDVVLPDGIGLKLLENPILQKKPIPMIFCSGYTGTRSRWETIKNRGIPFLQKPFTVEELLAKVNEVL